MLNLCWYFMVFSFIGWLSEGLRSMFAEKKFHNHGFLASPFCPAYGACAVFISVCFSCVANRFLLFVCCVVTVPAVIMLIGFVCGKILKFKPWDFSGYKFHIGSYMTVPYALLIGVAGTIYLALLVPLLDALIAFIPLNISVAIIICFAVFLLLDYVFSFVTLALLTKKISKLSHDADLMINDISQEKLDEIRENYNRLFTENRLRKHLAAAFPDLKKRVYLRKISDKLTMVKELNLKEYTAVYDNKEEKPFAFGLCFTKLFYLFVLGSFFGTLLETIWALIVEGHFEFRVGMVYGPFIPVYGGGACLLTVVLYKLYKLKDPMIFVISAVVGGAFEYICSYFQETILGTVSWDYSNTPFNFNGRTNLMFSLIWGFLGLVWVRYLYPGISKLIEKIPKKPASFITTALVIFMIFNAFMSVSAVWRWNERSKDIAAENVFERYLDRHFDDEKMNTLFPHMENTENELTEQSEDSE